MVRGAMEVKLLMGALEGPHKEAMAPKGPQEAPKRPKMAKNDYTSRKNWKMLAKLWIKIHFFADSTDKW